MSAPNAQSYCEDFENFDEFSWFLEDKPSHGTHMYLYIKQETQKVIDERKAAGMSNSDLKNLINIQCCNRIRRNMDDRDFWMRDLTKSGRWNRELHDAIYHHYYVLESAIFQAFNELMPQLL